MMRVALARSARSAGRAVHARSVQVKRVKGLQPTGSTQQFIAVEGDPDVTYL